MALSKTLKKDESLTSVSILKCLCTLLKMHFLGSMVQILLLYLYCNCYLPQNRWTDLGNININRSQIHECGNSERACAVSFLGIFVSNFWYSAFSEHATLKTFSNSTTYFIKKTFMMPIYFVCRDSIITKYRFINFLYTNNVPCIDTQISQRFFFVFTQFSKQRL